MNTTGPSSSDNVLNNDLLFIAASQATSENGVELDIDELDPEAHGQLAGKLWDLKDTPIDHGIAIQLAANKTLMLTKNENQGQGGNTPPKIKASVVDVTRGKLTVSTNRAEVDKAMKEAAIVEGTISRIWTRPGVDSFKKAHKDVTPERIKALYEVSPKSNSSTAAATRSATSTTSPAAASGGVVSLPGLATYIRDTMIPQILNNRALPLNSGWTLRSETHPTALFDSAMYSECTLWGPEGKNYVIYFNTGEHGITLLSNNKPLSLNELYNVLIQSGLLTKEEVVRAEIAPGQQTSGTMVAQTSSSSLATRRRSITSNECLLSENTKCILTKEGAIQFLRLRDSKWEQDPSPAPGSSDMTIAKRGLFRPIFAAIVGEKHRNAVANKEQLRIFHLPSEGVTLDEMGGEAKALLALSYNALYGSPSIEVKNQLVLPPNSVMAAGGVFITGPIDDKKAYYKNLICASLREEPPSDVSAEDLAEFKSALADLKSGVGIGSDPFVGRDSGYVRVSTRNSLPFTLSGPHALVSYLSGVGPLQTISPPLHLQMIPPKDRESRLSALHRTLTSRLGTETESSIDSFTGLDGSNLKIKKEGDNIVIEAGVLLNSHGFGFSSNMIVSGLVKVILDPQGHHTYSAVALYGNEKLIDLGSTEVSSPYMNFTGETTTYQAWRAIRDNYCTSLLALVEEHAALNTLTLVAPNAVVDMNAKARSVGDRMADVARRLQSLSQNQPEGMVTLFNPTLVSQDSTISISWKPLEDAELKKLNLKEGYRYTFSKTFRGQRESGSGQFTRNADVVAGMSTEGVPFAKLFIDRTDRSSSKFSGSTEKSKVSVFEKKGVEPIKYSKTEREFYDPEFLSIPTMTQTYTTTSSEEAKEDLRYLEQILVANQALLSSPSTIEPWGKNLKGELVPDSQLLASRLVLQSPIQMSAYLQQNFQLSLTRGGETLPLIRIPVKGFTSISLPLTAHGIKSILSGAGLQPRLIEQVENRLTAQAKERAKKSLESMKKAFFEKHEFDFDAAPPLSPRNGQPYAYATGDHRGLWKDNPLLQAFESQYIERLCALPHYEKGTYQSVAHGMMALSGGQSYRDVMEIFCKAYLEHRTHGSPFTFDVLKEKLHTYVTTPGNERSWNAVELAIGTGQMPPKKLELEEKRTSPTSAQPKPNEWGIARDVFHG